MTGKILRFQDSGTAGLASNWLDLLELDAVPVKRKPGYGPSKRRRGRMEAQSRRDERVRALLERAVATLDGIGQATGSGRQR